MSQFQILSATPQSPRLPALSSLPAFHDETLQNFLQTINPLQHIPVLGQAYREVSHTKISNSAQLAGHIAIGAAVGGPIGAAAGAGVFVLEHLVPGVFRFVGKLFSSGKSSNQATDIPKLKLTGVVDKAPAPELPATRHNQKIVPQLSNSQFERLFSSFAATPDNTNHPLVPQDLSSVITANLDKYRKLQHLASPAASASY